MRYKYFYEWATKRMIIVMLCQQWPGKIENSCRLFLVSSELKHRSCQTTGKSNVYLNVEGTIEQSEAPGRGRKHQHPQQQDIRLQDFLHNVINLLGLRTEKKEGKLAYLRCQPRVPLSRLAVCLTCGYRVFVK